MLSVKAREAEDTIFQVFDMTRLRIDPGYHALQANALIDVLVVKKIH